ncbi:hypothetical protein TrRE_jg13584 [Triparma retinervis]|uniref:Plastid lipid-associated protein/fibrillin conserved domain-containing protein n=1 Tax=Triparma retinervis TaxID=2557542 RepID=A0A9W7FUB2_9STRA|nr:hypothetical protein TrRE_jg13584 [Triparma retinervis]
MSPPVEPTVGLNEGSSSSPLKACWRLVYTSASDVSTLSANSFASLGGIYQDARELPVITNVIDLSPRVLQNLPPGRAAEALATATRIKVKTRARTRSPTRVNLPQIGLGIQRAVFGVSDDEDPRDAPTNPAFFDILYLDSDFLVIRQGSPGGMFAAIKVDDLSSS